MGSSQTSGPVFSTGTPDRGNGLEALAEDGDPSMLSSVLMNQMGIQESGVFNTPEGASGPGPLLPGHVYQFTFDATPGSYLSFASMFVPSNDLFYGPDTNGIALFNDKNEPIMGDITSMIFLWDAGTEINQEPGVGIDQPQRQSGPNTGATDPNNTVRIVDDGYTYPLVSEVIKVVVNPVPTGIEDLTNNIAQNFTLDQNYPNPFNPETTIKYSLNEPGKVVLSIYNALGQKVTDLVNEVQNIGQYQVRWGGQTDSGSIVSSGHYFYRLSVNNQIVIRKMTLIK